MAKQKAVDFEKALGELEELVSKMESGELNLDQSLSAFEAGIKLTRECQAALDKAEQKVQLLLERHGEIISEDFASDELED